MPYVTPLITARTHGDVGVTHLMTVNTHTKTKRRKIISVYPKFQCVCGGGSGGFTQTFINSLHAVRKKTTVQIGPFFTLLRIFRI